MPERRSHIGDGSQLQQALNRAVLAVFAVQDGGDHIHRQQFIAVGAVHQQAMVAAVRAEHAGTQEASCSQLPLRMPSVEPLYFSQRPCLVMPTRITSYRSGMVARASAHAAAETQLTSCSLEQLPNSRATRILFACCFILSGMLPFCFRPVPGQFAAGTWLYGITLHFNTISYLCGLCQWLSAISGIFCATKSPQPAGAKPGPRGIRYDTLSRIFHNF